MSLYVVIETGKHGDVVSADIFVHAESVIGHIAANIEDVGIYCAGGDDLLSFEELKLGIESLSEEKPSILWEHSGNGEITVFLTEVN